MKPDTRDLLVLARKTSWSEAELQHEISFLNQMLLRFESMHHFAIANEIADVNRYKIFRKSAEVEKIIRKGILKPFQFICNKN